MTVDEWARFREIRVEMLTEVPDAFAEDLATVLAKTAADWRREMLVDDPARGRFFVAADAKGNWAGIMGCRLPEGRSPELVRVFVRREYRGRSAGVAEALLAAVESWAGGFGSSLRLLVHEGNHRAIAFYRRNGFVPTGRTIPFPGKPEQLEVEMEKLISEAG